MIKPVFEERRGAVRAKRILSVEYRLHKSKIRNFDKSWHLSMTEDMSTSGLAFMTEHGYRMGDILELHVVMAGILDIFNGYGTVVRCEKKKTGVFYRVAVKFSDLRARRKIRPTKVTAKRK